MPATLRGDGALHGFQIRAAHGRCVEPPSPLQGALNLTIRQVRRKTLAAPNEVADTGARTDRNQEVDMVCQDSTGKDPNPEPTACRSDGLSNGLGRTRVHASNPSPGMPNDVDKDLICGMGSHRPHNARWRSARGNRKRAGDGRISQPRRPGYRGWPGYRGIGSPASRCAIRPSATSPTGRQRYVRWADGQSGGWSASVLRWGSRENRSEARGFRGTPPR